ncbi:putative T7SS-secreted protein [Streptomyces sp. 3N207]|uniref:putative T7SS-secreted protein n=1 Tax=Streptomyces sp. 3N207 TaxID=3457417 RepID=UPI003FD29972
MGFDLIPDSWEDKAEEVTEDIGDGIEGAGNWSADRLDDAGWESGGDWVRDKSRSAANRLGAETSEFQLDETEDPKKLIFGSPSKLRATAKHLKSFQTAFDNVAKGLKGLHKGTLKGKAADAFWEKVGLEPAKWIKAADACEKAAGALEDFAHTVERAQSQAREAIAKYKDDKKDEAQEQLDRARTQRNTAAGIAQTAIKAARDAAPPKPDYWDQAGDGLQGLQLDATHFSGGLIKGTAGLVNFVRGLNPADPYNITHPAEYVTNLNSTATGLLRVANDPVGTGKRMWDAFQKDPAEGTGRLIPELLGTKGAGIALKAGRAGKLASLADDVPGGRGALDGKGAEAAARGAKETPCKGTDPVDLATGRMYLSQTDLSLPGVLPLAFTRRVESGYRLGHWFGPSWSSTVDQRLEVDAKGIVFIGEDGRLLSFPHPAPGVPTLPSAGPVNMRLERTPDGGYTLTDPDTGWVRHFAPPEGGPDSEDDGAARIEQLTDRNGNSITFEYDTQTGAPSRLVHSGGYQVRLTVEGDRVTELALLSSADPALSVMRYGYTDGNLTEVINSSGRPLRFEYDDENRVIAWTDTNERRYDYVYDNLHRVIAEGGTAGHMQIRIDYDGIDEATGNRVTTVTTPEGHATRHLFNDRGQLTGQIDALGHRTRIERDPHNRPLAHTDALGRTTTLTYDGAGRLASVTHPDGSTVTITRNALGLPVATAEPDGSVWRQEWDAYGNRVSLTDPAGNTMRYAYDGRGHLVSVTDALGATTRIRCDAAGLPVEVTDPLGGVTRYERDAFGRPVHATDPTGARTELEWTIEGRPARRTGPDGTTERWEWDGEGNCIRHLNAAGAESTYEYGDFDVLSARTGPDGVRYAFAYDAELHLTRVTNPQGLTWDYSYDPVGRLVTETDFDNRTRRYEHDAAGQLTARITPLGDRISYEHDVLGRTTRKDAAGKVTTYAYDAAGRLAWAVGPDAEVRYHRDKLGRIKTELVDGRVVTHTYDALGRRTRRTTPTGSVSTSTYDAAGSRTSLTVNGHALDFVHDAMGRETERRIGDAGLALTHVWDRAGRLTDQSLALAGTETVQERRYSYRADGHLTGIEDLLAGPSTFDLDAAGRVTAVNARNWSETYAYDEAGNLTHASWPGKHAPEATGARAYNGTQVTTAGKVRYEHDAAGRLTLRQKTRLSKKPDTWRYTWDAEDRLTEVTTPEGSVWRYLYDPLGRRTEKRRMAPDGETVLERTVFTWDGSTLIEQTTTGADLPHPVTLTWDHDGTTPLSQTERRTEEATQQEIDARFFAIVTDLVGTPTELVDESGGIAWRSRSTLWGATGWRADSTAYTPLRFPGQYHDPETGLHYNYFRYYDPETARYTTPDPLGLAPAPNPATYVDNPQAFTDVLGLAPKCGPSLKDRLKSLFGGGGSDEAPAPEPPREPLALPPGRPDIGEPATLYGPFHRKGSPTQTPEVVQQVLDSGELWGRLPRTGTVEAAQAHIGRLPADAVPGSFEFYTSVKPTGMSHMTGYSSWELGGQGVGHTFHNGDDFARIPVFVTEVR